MHLVRIADPSMRLTADYQYKQAARGSDGALAAAARGPALAFPGRARFDPTDARWAPSARKLTGDAGRCPPHGIWRPGPRCFASCAATDRAAAQIFVSLFLSQVTDCVATLDWLGWSPLGAQNPAWRGADGSRYGRCGRGGWVRRQLPMLSAEASGCHGHFAAAGRGFLR
jgi:hypothetical protein